MPWHNVSLDDELKKTLANLKKSAQKGNKIAKQAIGPKLWAINAAVFFRGVRGNRVVMFGKKRPHLFINPQAAYFPFQIDAGGLAHFFADSFAQSFNVFGSGVSGVDKKIAMLVRNLGATDLQIGAAGFFDQLPGAQTFGIFESGAGGFLPARLMFAAIA